MDFGASREIDCIKVRRGFRADVRFVSEKNATD
jgi:hypothetical protein